MRFLTIHSLPVGSPLRIHAAIERSILTNLHYAYRALTLVKKLATLPPGTNLHKNDQAVKALLDKDYKEAFSRMWTLEPIFAGNEEATAMGAASWLWADGRIRKAQQKRGKRFQAAGSVLFTFLPYWVMPDAELGRLQNIADLVSSIRIFLQVHCY